MKQVLLIEDDRWLAASIVRTLKKDFEVTCVSQLAGAMQYIDENQPDIIVADFMLDAENSLTLFHELATYDDTSRIPIIVYSTLGPELSEYSQQLKSYGVEAICDKATLTPGSLRRLINEQIAARKLAQ